MKLFSVLTIVFLLTASGRNCNTKNNTATVYKARLEIKAICMNYTVRLLEGNMDTSMIVARWVDETTQKTYTNVFALNNPCNLPAAIKEGDEFYFSIKKEIPEDCIACLAYYPVPPKRLTIQVIHK